METLMTTLQQHLPVPVLWRNGAYSREQQHGFVEQMDQRVKDGIIRSGKQNVQLIDCATAIEERVDPQIPSERALRFIQLLMNTLSTSYG